MAPGWEDKDHSNFVCCRLLVSGTSSRSRWSTGSGHVTRCRHGRREPCDSLPRWCGLDPPSLARPSEPATCPGHLSPAWHSGDRAQRLCLASAIAGPRRRAPWTGRTFSQGLRGPEERGTRISPLQEPCGESSLLSIQTRKLLRSGYSLTARWCLPKYTENQEGTDLILSLGSHHF